MLSKTKFFITFLLLSGLIFTACVDEPEIEPAPRPYTQLKVANFATNVDVMNVSIDNTNDGIDNPVSMSSFTSLSGGAVANNIGKGEMTAYFDVLSGDRVFTVRNASGDIVYNTNYNCGPYDEMILLFSGNYVADEDLSTFAPMTIWIGTTYLDDYHQMPDGGGEVKFFIENNESVLKVIHAAKTVDDGGAILDEAVEYTHVFLTNNGTAEIDTLFVDPLGTDFFTAEEYVGGIYESGNYSLEILRYEEDQDGNDSLAASATSTFDITAGTNTLQILHGEPSNSTLTKYEEQINTETRPK